MDPCTLDISGVQVKFPCQPYDIQVAFMTKVIDCLKSGRNGVLESPTGTGKTLSLLCATLAWQESLRNRKLSIMEGNELPGPSELGFGDKVPKIIYTTRTHTQISKAMKELRRIPYYKHVKMTLLGSRDQLCIHPLVIKEDLLSVKNTLCKYHIKSNSCAFYGKAQNIKSDLSFVNGVDDIEDLMKKCKKVHACPYFTARELQESADVIFLPYNYLLDSQIRKNMAPMLPNSVIIIDEAHNIDKMCEESSSVTIKTTQITDAWNDVKNDMQEVYQDRTDYSFNGPDVQREYGLDDLTEVQEALSKLDAAMLALNVGAEGTGISFKGSEIFETLRNADIVPENITKLTSQMRRISEYLINKTGNSISRKGFTLNKLADDLELIFSTLGPGNDTRLADLFFRTYNQNEELKSNVAARFFVTENKKPKILNFWCFSPSIGVSTLCQTGARSIIFTSGTLTPMNVTVKELGLVDPVTLENPHIIDSSQVLISIVPKGPTQKELNSSFNNRNNEEYWKELGLTLMNFARIIPDGVLVFFPSYSTMNKAVEIWQNHGVWTRISQIKPIFTEPQNKRELDSTMENYYKSIDEGRGGILIGVCRGKVSEGLDFTDRYGRGVILTGIPYPPYFDPKVKLKRNYIDTGRVIEGLTGDLWYRTEATRAVNQAIGRVIRHANDCGVILLCDSKFQQPAILQSLSRWLQPLIKNTSNFGHSISFLRQFINANRSRLTEATSSRELACADVTFSSCESTPSSTSCISSFQSSSQSCCQTQPSSVTQRGEVSRVSPPLKKLKSTKGGIIVTPEDTDEERVEYNVDRDIPKSLTLEQIITKSTKLDVQRAKTRPVKLRVLKFSCGEVDNPEEAEEARSRVDTSNFLMELKSVLDGESYSNFVSVLKKYQASENLKETLHHLVTLFPRDDEILKEFFKGCYRVFSGRHRKLFETFCNKFYND